MHGRARCSVPSPRALCARQLARNHKCNFSGVDRWLFGTGAERWNAYLQLEEQAHSVAAQLAVDARQASEMVAAATDALSAAFGALSRQYLGGRAGQVRR